MAINSLLTEKILLITGGTGSFGQTFAKAALGLKPRKVIIYSRGELLQWEMQQKFNDPRLEFVVGDVRDR